MKGASVKDIDPMYWKILAAVIALAAVWMFVLWLWEQWWFVPLLVLIGVVGVIAIVVWHKSRKGRGEEGSF